MKTTEKQVTLIHHRYMGGIQNDNISHIPFNEEAANTTVYESLLMKAASRSRIIAVCGSSGVIRDIMITASRTTLLDNGEFVFINVDLFRKGSFRTLGFNAIST